MPDDVTFTLNADSTPPNGTVAATDETASGPHSVGSHMGIAKLAVAADGDSTHVPATAADGLLVNLGVNNDVSISGTVATDDFGHGATGATTSVADNAASQSLLAANANRVKAIVTNDSSARLYIRLQGAAASTTDYSVSLGQNETWEEFNYTGEIRGIWASDPGDGAARVTEIS